MSLSFFQEEMEWKVKRWRVDRQVSCGGGIMEESGQLIQGADSPYGTVRRLTEGILKRVLQSTPMAGRQRTEIQGRTLNWKKDNKKGNCPSLSYS
ncbi:hypothetical protein CHARACLAT_018273 [Characodon lateralis]|uniref:Uncharacterized protein n=1 Tax=Characodon lateralis TaxID=208331 RepID=A0ABU7EKE3_9TELE|nr:hypothetical protein [Characodon lateralis]